jgi:hypothetical protein
MRSSRWHYEFFGFAVWSLVNGLKRGDADGSCGIMRTLALVTRYAVATELLFVDRLRRKLCHTISIAGRTREASLNPTITIAETSSDAARRRALACSAKTLRTPPSPSGPPTDFCIWTR